MKITELFQLCHISTVTCLNCNSSSQSDDSSLFMKIPIQSNANTDYIESYIQAQIGGVETILHNYNCKRCKSQYSNFANHTSQLQNCPEILVIHPIQYSSSHHYQIEIPSQISLQLIPQHENCIVQSTYEMKAIVTHLGSQSCGHCTAYCKINDVWWYCNDEYVSKIYGNMPFSSFYTKPYIMFYEKVSQVRL